MKQETILQYEPDINTSDQEAVTSYLESGGFITEFRKTREFEEKIANYCNSSEAVVYPNGTLTLFSIIKNLNIKKGDVVIVPNYTMAATAFSVSEAGAEVIFCDVEKNSLCLDFNSLKEKVEIHTSKVKAIIFMSANGRYPSYPIDDLVKFCKEKSIYLIEDSAQSLGSYYPNGKHIGTIGIAGSFSFSMPKIITTGQGGVIVSNNNYLIERLRKYKDFGRAGGGLDFHSQIGLNMKFTDLQAVLGISQLTRIEKIKKIKKSNFLYLKNNIKNSLLKIIDNDVKFTTPWFYEIETEKRDELIEHLNNFNIKSRIMYPELNRQEAYSGHPQYKEIFKNSSNISKNGLWIPSHPKLTEENIHRIVKALNSFKT